MQLGKPLAALTALLIAAGIAYFVAIRTPTPAPQSDPPRLGEGVRQGEPAQVSSAPGFFEEVTDSGIAFTHRNGEEVGHASILESLGGGVALIDYDRDGLLDIFVTGGGDFTGADKKTITGHPCKLYKNLGGYKFRDVTEEITLKLEGGQPWFYNHGVAVADYDNDGWPDLVVTGYGRVALFHNVPGEKGRRFVEVTKAAGVHDSLWSTSAGWGDIDGDGLPDLYICHYVNWSWENNPPCKDYRDQKLPDVCAPKRFDGLPDTLYRNNGNGTFTEIGAVAGLQVPRPDADYAKLAHLSPEAQNRLKQAVNDKDYGKGLGVLIADFDNDGRPDIYIGNDTSGNFLYMNRGGGKFEQTGWQSGAVFDANGRPTGSMGIDATDYNGTGLLSIFVSNYQNETHALYRNRGKGQFIHASTTTGVTALGLNFVGFGAGFLDFDLDGNEDLFISNGHVVHHPAPPAEVKQLPVLMRNLFQPGQKPHEIRFENIASKAGPYFQGRHLGRGAAMGDLDNRGRFDIVLNPCNEPVVLLRNRHETGHHWLGVQVVGKTNKDAVGARLELQLADGRKLTRAVKGGGSYLSSSDRRILFGLGTGDKIDKLTIHWPYGASQSWTGLKADQYWKVTEGVEKAEPANVTR